ncbi:hypothetical protein HNY73_001677 [Argiope bruennichi]|uniref:Uncharacterized protein n=1 Tax=Argiope bruennichi TaxID=94029 RepID=A0A8T0FTL2_ARGBR|nr:hypothetical protein HNY73_001677 [Argiope bruennichi]
MVHKKDPHPHLEADPIFLTSCTSSPPVPKAKGKKGHRMPQKLSTGLLRIRCPGGVSGEAGHVISKRAPPLKAATLSFIDPALRQSCGRQAPG